MGETGQRQRKTEGKLRRDPVKKVISRKAAEKDVLNRQTERWRQKVRRQRQKTERQTERKTELTEGDEGDRETDNAKTEGLRRTTRQRRMKVNWCIWCGIGCRGEEGGKCRERRLRRDRRRQKVGYKEVQGLPEGSGNAQGQSSSPLGPPTEGGMQVGVVRQPPNTQARSLCEGRFVFKGGGAGGEEGQPKEDRRNRNGGTGQAGEKGEREETERRGGEKDKTVLSDRGLRK